MRIEVVLPLPLGPRKPKISPRCACSDRSLTTCLSPKCLFSPRTSIAGMRRVMSRARAHCSVDRHRLPGRRRGASSARGPRLDHEHQLGARLVAVDDRRRVLGLVGDVAHRRRHVGAAAVAVQRHVAARLECRRPRPRARRSAPSRSAAAAGAPPGCPPAPIRLRGRGCRPPARPGVADDAASGRAASSTALDAARAAATCASCARICSSRAGSRDTSSWPASSRTRAALIAWLARESSSCARAMPPTSNCASSRLSCCAACSSAALACASCASATSSSGVAPAQAQVGELRLGGLQLLVGLLLGRASPAPPRA